MPAIDFLLFLFLMVIAFGGIGWFLYLANQDDDEE